MTTWRPTFSDLEGPLYLAIANSIAADVASGRLAEGERLPPQRDLASELNVALTTVTRAYTEAERRGLVSGEVGRGTFVLRKESFRLRPPVVESTAVNLTANSLLPYPAGPRLVASIADVLGRGEPWEVLNYQPHQGHPRHRAAGAELLKRFGVEASAESVLVTAGAQHAMAVVLGTLTHPGNLVLTGELTYAGMKSLANFLHLRLRGVLMDDEGIRPDALEAAAATTSARVLYCMPTLQNPTASVMSEARRRDVVRVAESYGVAVVEDDSYGFLLPQQTPLVSLASSPSSFYYLTGTAKSLAPGLRIGYVHAPLAMVDRLAAALSSTTILAPPPTAEIVSRWIQDGTAERVMDWKRGEVRARQKLAKAVLRGLDYRAHAASPHGWLHVPEPWTVGDFVEQARMRGVLVSPAEDFIAARSTSAHAVRICLGPVRDRARLEQALAILVDILERPPAPRQAVV